MEMMKIILFIIVMSLIILLLKSYKGEYAALLQIGLTVMVGFVVISSTGKLLESIEDIASISSEAALYLKVLLKALSIGIMTDFASSFCIDCSNVTLAKGVELIGKTAILSLSIPLLKEFTERIIAFIR